jgi:hypothetical protein
MFLDAAAKHGGLPCQVARPLGVKRIPLSRYVNETQSIPALHFSS